MLPKIFHPKSTELELSVLLDTINCELEEEINKDHTKLTDEFLQEMADAWYSEDEPGMGPLWDGPDDLSEEWIEKIKNQFK